jgi:hypothetical protein
MFVMNVLMHLDINVRDECNAWLALADLVDLVVASARIKITVEQLQKAVEKFLDRFVVAWGCDWMTPKFHWLLHFASLLFRYPFLLMCFCLERKHRVAKRYAGELTNPSITSSESVLKEVVSHHFGQLKSPTSFDYSAGLVGPRAISKAGQRALYRGLDLDCSMHEVMSSVVMRFSAFATCAKNDIVLLKRNGSNIAGAVQMHISVDAVPVSLVTIFELVQLHAGTGYAVWKKTDTSVLIEATDIIDVLITTQLPDGRLGSIVPLEFRK